MPFWWTFPATNKDTHFQDMWDNSGYKCMLSVANHCVPFFTRTQPSSYNVITCMCRRLTIAEKHGRYYSSAEALLACRVNLLSGLKVRAHRVSFHIAQQIRLQTRSVCNCTRLNRLQCYDTVAFSIHFPPVMYRYRAFYNIVHCMEPRKSLTRPTAAASGGITAHRSACVHGRLRRTGGDAHQRVPAR